MKSAEELFKEIGYQKVNRYSNRISYERVTPKGDIEAIDFPLDQGQNPTFCCFINSEPSYVYVRELPAIMQQVKEMGWINNA